MGRLKVNSFTTALIIAVISDSIDILFIIPADIPVSGDIIDVLTMILLHRYIGVYAVPSMIEFIPASDPLPMHTLGVLMFKYNGKKQ
tara:strand:+ start:331 stop:591 length:261 start_codon:yes stop_codon:yes gene_type:complete